MSKKIFVDCITGRTGVKKSVATDAANDIIYSLSMVLRAKGKVNIPTIGTIVVQNRKSRIGRNPRTGEQVIVPEKKTIRMKPSAILREFVNVRSPWGARVR